MVTEPPEVDSKSNTGGSRFYYYLRIIFYGVLTLLYVSLVCLNFQRVPIGLQDVLGDPHEHLNYNKGSRIDIGHPLSYTPLT